MTLEARRAAESRVGRAGIIYQLADGTGGRVVHTRHLTGANDYGVTLCRPGIDDRPHCGRG